MIIKRGGDTEENPGPQYNSCQSFFVFHWNLNSICAYNFVKLSLLRAYIAVNQCDILSQKVFLDIGIFSDDVNSDIPGYNLVKANHPAKAKCGVCIYFRKSLPLSILDIHFLHECINIQMRIGNKGRDMLYDQAYNASFHRKLESI